MNVWYLDDGTLASDSETVLADYRLILETGRTLGLEVNPNKCELCLLNPQSPSCFNALEKFTDLTDGIRLIQREDLTL